MNTQALTKTWSRRAAATALSATLLGGAALYHPPSHSQAGTVQLPDFTEMVIDLEVWDLKHLNRLISQLKTNEAVSVVKRVNG